MREYSFSLPWPPTVNHFHQPIVKYIFKNGKKKAVARIIKGSKARDYSDLATGMLMMDGLAGENLKGRLSVVMTLNPPTLAKYDIDNRTKSVFDALSESGFWVDDEQVDRLTISKGEKVKGGRIDLHVMIID